MSNEPTKEPQPYIPALGFDWLTRFYDPVLRATLREDKFKRLLIEQARIEPGHDVLDLGCGTATLTIMVKQSCPAARVVGLDGDSKVLAIARQKHRHCRWTLLTPSSHVRAVADGWSAGRSISPDTTFDLAHEGVLRVTPMRREHGACPPVFLQASKTSRKPSTAD